MAKAKAAPVGAPPVSAGVPYPHELPRWLHKDGETLRVDTPAACDAALAAGWLLRPLTGGAA